MSLTARAERIMLRARAGGVPVQAALSSLDRAIDAQIELEALRASCERIWSPQAIHAIVEHRPPVNHYGKAGIRASKGRNQ